MNKKKLNKIKLISEKVISKCSDVNLESELNIQFTSEATSRFANSQITQNILEEKINLSLAVYKDKKYTNVTTTDVSEKGIEALVKNVLKTINSSSDDPVFQGFVEESSLIQYPKIDMKSSFWDVEKRAMVIKNVVDTAESISSKVKMAGTCATEDTIHHFESSNGRNYSYQFITNQFKVNAIYEEGNTRGYGQKDIYWRKDLPDIEKMTKDAVNIAKSTINNKNIEPGTYKVVLSPQAVSDLILFIQYTLLASYFHEGQSFTEELDKKIFDSSFSIKDKPLDPLLSRMSMPIDFEGVARSNRDVILEGVLKGVPYSTYEASQYLNDKNKSTGTSFDHTISLFASFVQKPGTSDLQDLFRDVNNGLFVNRFWYTRPTDPTVGGLTGITRYGLFKIENGEITDPVNNLRYNDAFTEFWKEGNVIGLANELVMNEISTTCAMALNEFKFTSKA